MKKCPYCAEEIQDEAIICRFCNREFPNPAPAHPPVQSPPVVTKKKKIDLASGCAIAGGCILFFFVFLPMVVYRSCHGNGTPRTTSVSTIGSTTPRPTVPQSENVIYAKGKTNVRSAPEVGAPIVRKTHPGEIMVVFRRNGDWCKISPSRSEWIHSSVVTTERPEPREPSPTAKPTPRRPRTSADRWINPGGHIWSGLKIYVGTETGEKTLIGTVIGGNSDEIMIAYESGRIGWQNRRAVVLGDTFWCRADDPAIGAERWRVLER